MLTSASDRLWAECGSNDLLSLRHTKISIACSKLLSRVFSSHDYASRLVTVSVVWAAPSSVGLKG
jgi:hypothetical protein